MPKYRVVTTGGTYVIETAGETAPEPSLHEGLQSAGPVYEEGDTHVPQRGWKENLADALRPLAKPQNADDIGNLLMAGDNVGKVLQTAPKMIGVLRSMVPSQQTVGKVTEFLGENGPTLTNPLRPVLAGVKRGGQVLQERAVQAAEAKGSTQATGTPSTPRASNGPYQEWSKPSAGPLESGAKEGVTEPPWMRNNMSNPDTGSPNATGSVTWAPERPVPSHVIVRSQTPPPPESSVPTYRANDPNNRVVLSDAHIADPTRVKTAARAGGASRAEAERVSRQRIIDFLSSSKWSE